LLYGLSPFAIVLLGLLLYFTLIEDWFYMRLAPAVAVEKIYRSLYRVGRSLAGERTRAETAYEFMGKLIERVSDIREHSRYTNYLLRAPQDVQYLTDMYQDTLFARHTIAKSDARTALNTWQHLRLRLLLARFYVVARRVFFPTKQSPHSIRKISSPQRTTSRG
jgi:hypothetical protein